VKIRRRFVAREGSDHTDLAVESRDGRHVTVRIGDRETVADFAKLPGGRGSAILPSGRQLSGRAPVGPDGRVELWVDALPVELELADPLKDRARDPDHGVAAASEVRAQIPGRVVEVLVAKGDIVAAGATLLVLEAMKMQNEIRAGARARVAALHCAPGQTVERGEILVRLEPLSVS
jgi:biotin carboxyl carrier protein